MSKMMKCYLKSLWNYCFGAMMFCMYINANGQKVITSLDSSKILIGDHVHLRINITAPSLDSIKSAVLNDSLIAPFEIVSQEKTDTLKIGNEFSIIQNYTLICFNSGNVFFPSLSYSLQGKLFQTDSISLQVETIKLDTTGQLKPIKGPIQVPMSFKEVLPYFYWLFLAAALILISVYLYKKYFAPKEEALEEKVIEPPHIIALKKLKIIEEEKLWQQEKIKEYHIKVSDTIREYIENRFSVHAMEQTTDELLISLKRVRVNASNRSKIERILSMADLAKFAKTQPLPNENIESMSMSIDFIDKTKQNTELEDRHTATLVQKKIYASNEYKLMGNSLSKFNMTLLIYSIIAAILIPFIFTVCIYGFGLISLIILITNYGIEIASGFILILGIVSYIIYCRKKKYVEYYRIIFSSNGITERKKGKKDVHFSNEQIRSITENKKGILGIYTADISQKIMISPFIERREEIKERLAQITPVEFV